MKNEAREAIAGMRSKLDSIALSMDMIDTDDGWEYDKPAIRDRVWESTPSLLLHDLVSLATRIEDLESDLQTLESIEDNDLMEHAYKSSAELAEFTEAENAMDMMDPSYDPSYPDMMDPAVAGEVEMNEIEDLDLMEHAYKSSAELATDRVRTLTEVEGPFRSEDC